MSDLHVYLTEPFITSWSLLDAMSCGCTILASDQNCVREYIKDGENVLEAEIANEGGPAGFVLKLILEGTDNKTRQVITDDSWQVATSRDATEWGKAKIVAGVRKPESLGEIWWKTDKRLIYRAYASNPSYRSSGTSCPACRASTAKCAA